MFHLCEHVCLRTVHVNACFPSSTLVHALVTQKLFHSKVVKEKKKNKQIVIFIFNTPFTHTCIQINV